MRNKISRRIAVTVGGVVLPERPRALGDRNAATAFLRQATHGLAGGKTAQPGT